MFEPKQQSREPNPRQNDQKNQHSKRNQENQLSKAVGKNRYSQQNDENGSVSFTAENKQHQGAVSQLKSPAGGTPQAKITAQLKEIDQSNTPQGRITNLLRGGEGDRSADTQPAQRKETTDSTDTSSHVSQASQNGLPDGLRSGIENLSGIDMGDVKVHYNSSKPAQLQAHAYAQGTDIHLASGQEKHLPHEAWHVVQQKQGRVKPTVQLKGKVGINDDAGLEREADVMGAKAQQVGYSSSTAGSASVQAKTVAPYPIQMKRVSTDYGTFETTNFEDLEDKSGINITLEFQPNPNKVDATKIGMSQSVKNSKSPISGREEHMTLDLSAKTRMVTGKKKSAGYHIDQIAGVNNPLYSEEASLAAGEELKDTPDAAANFAKRGNNETPHVGDNINYELGHCYKVNPTDRRKTVRPAVISDGPTGNGDAGDKMEFETTALAIDGVQEGKYYGSVKWGFEIGYENGGAVVKKMDIKRASKGTPTANFKDAAALWNTTYNSDILVLKEDTGMMICDPKNNKKTDKDREKWEGGDSDTEDLGTEVVAEREDRIQRQEKKPDFLVMLLEKAEYGELKKGTKLRHMQTIATTQEEQVLLQELADGAPTGRLVICKMSEVALSDEPEDQGNPNVPLPEFEKTFFQKRFGGFTKL